MIPGRSATVDAWMQMLNDRREEFRETLGSERMAVEAIFGLTDEHGEGLYWVELCGTEGCGLTEERAIDRDHIAFARQAMVPGYEVAVPEPLLLPAPVERADQPWETAGPGDSSPEP